jgi:hypothetical protein
MQTYFETGDHKLNEIQVRFDDLPAIFNRFYIAQSELELSDDADHSGNEKYLKISTTK